jgi:hypothetical protein
MGIFRSLRNAVKSAFLAGVQDALTELNTARVEEPEPVVLRLGYRPDGPAAEEPARARGRKVSV